MPRPSIEPKHRASGPRPARTVQPSTPVPAGSSGGKHRASRSRTPRRLRVLLPGLATTATALAICTGVVAGDQPETTAASSGYLSADLTAAAPTVDSKVLATLEAERDLSVSRSADRRTSVDRRKLRLLTHEAESGGQVTRTVDLGSGDPRAIARTMLADFGFSATQFPCLDALWTKESGWNLHADNPSSSAYGIPQALPGSKMAAAGADWATNPATQIRWGLGYIAARYGSPCGAWGHSQSYNWY